MDKFDVDMMQTILNTF